MALTSAQFLIFCSLTLVLFRLCPFAGLRLAIVLLANLLFLASMLNGWVESWALAAFAALGYLGVQIASRLKSGASLGICIAVVVALFIVVKYGDQLSLLRNLPAFSVIGLSYILFRVLHLIIDLSQDELEHRPSFFEFLAYIFYFPALLSGPVNRYDGFIQSICIYRRLSYEEVERGVARTLHGLVKIMIVAPAVQQFFLYFSRNVIAGAPQTLLSIPLDSASLGATSPTIGLPLCVVAASALYTGYLYFNFSGYTHFVIGISGLFGVTLPENFDHPFKAGNVSDFWSRWHMSLSEWFKTYVFTALALSISTVLPGRRWSLVAACLCLFISFLLIGLWHGNALVFLYYGLYLGLAAALHKLYQHGATKMLDQKQYRALARHWAYAGLCRGLTFAYFAVALICFWMNAAQVTLLASQLGASGVALALAALTIFAAAWLSLYDVMAGALRRLISALLGDREFAGRQIWMATQCFAVLAVAVLFNSAPGFVYQGF